MSSRPNKRSTGHAPSVRPSRSRKNTGLVSPVTGRRARAKRDEQSSNRRSFQKIICREYNVVDDMNQRNGDSSGYRRRSLCYCVIRRRQYTTTMTRTERKYTHQPHARTLTSLVINIHVPKASIEFSSPENMFNIFFIYIRTHIPVICLPADFHNSSYQTADLG